MGEDTLHFRARKYHWKLRRFLGALDLFQPADLLLQHLLVKKQQRAQRLVLRGWRYIKVARQMREKFRHFCLRHFGRMPFVMINNEALDPIEVSLLGADAVMLAPDDVAHLIEQFRFVSLCPYGYDRGHGCDCQFSLDKLKPD